MLLISNTRSLYISKTASKSIVTRLISSRNKTSFNRLLQSRTSTTSLRRLPKIILNNNNNYAYNYDHLFRIDRTQNVKNKSLIGSAALQLHNRRSNLVHHGTASNKSVSMLNGASSPKYFLNGSEETKENSDLIVVLDMDECLIHSQFLSLENETFRQHEKRPSTNKTNFCDSFCITLRDESSQTSMVHVNKRPNLEKFLKHVTSKYQTYIFTAAMKVYANPVLNIILDEDEEKQNRFYRESCIYDANLGVYVKDLNHVLQATRNNQDKLKRMVLVDNNPLSFLANPSNGILVSSFYDDPKDDTLPAVMDLLEELDGLEDVRPALHHLFGLEDALNDIVAPSFDGSYSSSW